MACECRTKNCRKLVAGGARGGYCEKHAKRREERKIAERRESPEINTNCHLCGKLTRGPYRVAIDGQEDARVCEKCFKVESAKELREHKVSSIKQKIVENLVAETNKIAHKTKQVQIFEEEIKARIGYEVLEQFECCNTCHSRAGELCNKWHPNTFKHGAFEAKCRYYARGGS